MGVRDAWHGSRSNAVTLLPRGTYPVVRVGARDAPTLTMQPVGTGDA
jgi:hypothetical protein